MTIYIEHGAVALASRDIEFLIGKTLDEVRQVVKERNGKLERISSVGFHTCVDQPNELCSACEDSKEDPRFRSLWEIQLGWIWHPPL